MSYTPATDFLALARRTGGGVRMETVPGLDYMIAGLMRAGMFLLWTGTTAPVTNLGTTVWLRPAQPSWSAEGAVFLYDALGAQFVPATPELWSALFSGSIAISVTQIGIAQSPYVVLQSDSVIYVNSSGGPVVLTLQAAAARVLKPLSIKDITGNADAVGHNISIIPHGAETVEGLNPLLINAAYGGFRLYPATAKYVIAP